MSDLVTSKYGRYLGQFQIKPPAGTDVSPAALALSLIGRYGGYDGEHHKTWVLDQVARILNGAPITWYERRWERDNHREQDFTVGTCARYQGWVRDLKNGEDGPDTYHYSEGIAP